MRRICLCADDYGISPAVNLAIRDLVVRGRLNATSVLVVAPSFGRSEAIALDMLNAVAPRVSVGLHIGLTAPFRPLSEGLKPLKKGAFTPLAVTVRNALLRRFDQEALEAEIRSQADVFLRLFGRAPDFIDGHQHVHLLPQIGEAVLCVAKEVAPNGWVRQCGQGVPLLATVADPKGFFLDLLSRRFRHRAAALGVRTNPAFAGTYEFTDTADFSRLFPRFLANLPQDGLLMCHPGFVDAELLRLDPLTALREREHAFLASDRFVGLLAREGVTLH